MIVYPSQNGLIKSWTDGVPVEDEAVAQVESVADMPFVWPHVAVMPDVHVGMGATIGSVIPTEKAIIPAAIGVDIGCGMRAVRLEGRPDQIGRKAGCYNLGDLRYMIEQAVPHGRTHDGGERDRGSWGNIPKTVQDHWDTYLGNQYEKLCEEIPAIRHRRPVNQLGTLGTGNHFIELCVFNTGETWLVLHSGSRGPGARIANVFIRMAKDLMKK
jgi:tRNA-splicing ligase RtcB